MMDLLEIDPYKVTTPPAVAPPHAAPPCAEVSTGCARSVNSLEKIVQLIRSCFSSIGQFFASLAPKRSEIRDQVASGYVQVPSEDFDEVADDPELTTISLDDAPEPTIFDQIISLYSKTSFLENLETLHKQASNMTFMEYVKESGKLLPKVV